MAKLGEGDQRWIVDDRKDGTNVNQWHWQETDCLEWTKKKLNETFEGKNIGGEGEPGALSLALGTVEVTGEAYINNRKGKLIAGYELCVNIPFKATGNVVQAGGVEVLEGKVEFPYIGDENQDEDCELKVNVQAFESSESEKRRMAEAVRQSVLAKHKTMFVSELNGLVKALCQGGPALEKKTKAEGKKPTEETGRSAPTKATEEEKKKEKESNTKKKEQQQQAVGVKTKVSHAGSASKSKSAGKSIEIKEDFYCRPSDLWDCYMEEGRVRAYTQSDVRIVPKEGETFSLFNGSIEGKQIELVKNEKIVQDWRSSSWPKGVFSRVVITFTSPSEGKTVMKLVQTGIPEEDDYGNSNTTEVTRQGWRMQIWGRVRQCFGYGC